MAEYDWRPLADVTGSATSRHYGCFYVLRDPVPWVCIAPMATGGEFSFESPTKLVWSPAAGSPGEAALTAADLGPELDAAIDGSAYAGRLFLTWDGRNVLPAGTAELLHYGLRGAGPRCVAGFAVHPPLPRAVWADRIHPRTWFGSINDRAIEFDRSGEFLEAWRPFADAPVVTLQLQSYDRRLVVVANGPWAAVLQDQPTGEDEARVEWGVVERDIVPGVDLPHSFVDFEGHDWDVRMDAVFPRNVLIEAVCAMVIRA